MTETCARCGHSAPDCDTCGWTTPILGGLIDGQPYCHTYTPIARPPVVPLPSCYTQETWERGGLRDAG